MNCDYNGLLQDMRSLYDELGGQNAVHPVDEELFKATEKKN